MSSFSCSERVNEWSCFWLMNNSSSRSSFVEVKKWMNTTGYAFLCGWDVRAGAVPSRGWRIQNWMQAALLGSAHVHPSIFETGACKDWRGRVHRVCP